MSGKLRNALRAEMIAFACSDIEELDDEQFAEEVETFFACLAKRYRCSHREIREFYASEIDALGYDEYFFGFRPELN